METAKVIFRGLWPSRAYCKIETVERHWIFWRKRSTVRYDLTKISVDEMTKLIEREGLHLRGVPIYFDALGRVWPAHDGRGEIKWE